MIPTGRQNIESRIIGGNNATAGQFPFIVSLQAQGYGHFCAASIVSQRYAITASHCTFNRSASSITIRAGSLTHNEGGVVYRVALVKAHPQYVESTRANDIAIIQTDQAIKFDNLVQAIGLSTIYYNISGATAMGWGTKSVSRIHETLLKYI